MIQFVLGLLAGLIAYGVALLFHAPQGVAATWGLVIFLAAGLGTLVISTDSNWFD